LSSASPGAIAAIAAVSADIRFPRLVGRENVIAGSDCGFSSQATYHPEVHPTVVWAKFQAMAEGARLATAQLWR
jgi:5-methyltetrahydropteroyltriglutamate--homocysteine methyltransferase